MTEKEILSEARIIELIHAYGSRLENWPTALAEAAGPMFDQPSPAISTALTEEARLDAALTALPDVEVPQRLYEAVLANAPMPSQTNRRLLKSGVFMGWGTRFAAAASALGVGLTIGLGTAAASAPVDDPFSDQTYFTLDLDDFAAQLEEVPE